MTIHIGTSGWSYDHWRGVFYPEKLPKNSWFNFYAEQFNTVEVNATFYCRFTDSIYRKWHVRAPENFRYVLKVPRLISHRHKLHDVAGLSDILTGDTGYLRLHGRRAWYADRHTEAELRGITDTARRMLQQGAREVYIFFNNDYGAYAPDNAAALSRLV